MAMMNIRTADFQEQQRATGHRRLSRLGQGPRGRAASSRRWLFRLLFTAATPWTTGTARPIANSPEPAALGSLWDQERGSDRSQLLGPHPGGPLIAMRAAPARPRRRVGAGARNGARCPTDSRRSPRSSTSRKPLETGLHVAQRVSWTILISGSSWWEPEGHRASRSSPCPIARPTSDRRASLRHCAGARKRPRRAVGRARWRCAPGAWRRRLRR